MLTILLKLNLYQEIYLKYIFKNNKAILLSYYNNMSDKYKKQNIEEPEHIQTRLLVENKSGKIAKVVITPCPIKTISLIGLEKIGQFSFTLSGDYLPQEMMINDKKTHTFELDNSPIYYTTFFYGNKEWRLARKNVKHDSNKYNLVLYPEHANETQNFLNSYYY